MTIGENIKFYRRKLGLSQKELGERLGGISQQQIGKWENNNKNPKLETIEKIAAALNVPISKIVENISFDQYKATDEYKKTEKKISAYQGIEAIINHIYGGFEEKNIQAEYGEEFYYTVGNGNNQFILYEGDIEKLLDYVVTLLPFIVNEIKEKRPENVVYDEIMAELNDENYINQAKKYRDDCKKK